MQKSNNLLFKQYEHFTHYRGLFYRVDTHEFNNMQSSNININHTVIIFLALFTQISCKPIMSNLE